MPAIDANYQVSDHERYDLNLSLELNSILGSELAEVLEEVVEGKERRVQLPMDGKKSWLLFFKVSKGDNRNILAHPDHDEWVGTVSLQKQFMEEMLKRVKSGKDFVTAEECSLNRLSNFHFEIRFS